jgi:hypothetical protein
MYACKSLKMQGNLCIEFYAQKCERNSIRGRRIFIGFPDKLAKPAFYAGLVSLDFTGDNRGGASQCSNQCGDCRSTQKSVHKSGYTLLFFGGALVPGGVRHLCPNYSGKESDNLSLANSIQRIANITLFGDKYFFLRNY